VAAWKPRKTQQIYKKRMTAPAHIKWLKDHGKNLKTAAGNDIQVLELEHKDDAAVISEWARYFREHYCLDKVLDEARQGTGLSRKQYLKQFVFPNNLPPGPSTRAGDFAEILVADYFEYLQEWIVPRTRYRLKPVPNQSTKGTDVLAFLLTGKTDLEKKQYSPSDVLMCVEVKAQFSAGKAEKRLQHAVDDSAKDQFRKAVALNAMKMRLRADGDQANVRVIERFQNLPDRPYQTRYTAAAFHCTCNYDSSAVTEVDISKHPEKDSLARL
jgi:hypothetical protein